MATPAEIFPSNLVGHWKADANVYSDAGSTLANTTETVQQWNNQGSGGFNLVMGTSGNRPQYITNAINGLPCVRFSGTKWMTGTYQGNSLPLYIVCVFVRKGAGGGTGWQQVVSTNDPGIGGMAIGWSDQLTATYDLHFEIKDATFFRYPGLQIVANKTYMAEGQWTGTIGGSASLSGWINDHLAVSGATYTHNAHSNATGMFVGNLAGDTSFGAQADIGEIIMYEGTTTAQQRADLRAYLVARWGYTPFENFEGTSRPRKYLIAGFTDSANERMHVHQSDDGATWVPIPTHYKPTSGTFRDGSYDYDASTGKHWVVYSNNGFNSTTTFGLASSTDMVNWTTVANVSCAGISGVTFVWTPKWFVESDGTRRIVVTCTTEAAYASGGFKLYELHPTNAGRTTWSAPVEITGTGLSTNIIDAQMFQLNGTGKYYIVCKDEDTGYLEILSSSSMLTGYTELRAGNWASLGTPYEGCSFVLGHDGIARIFFDDYNVTTNGMSVVRQTAGDWTGSGSTTWSAKAALTVQSTRLRNGVVVYPTNIGSYRPRGRRRFRLGYSNRCA